MVWPPWGTRCLFTGTWWVPSSTNLWGIDPGDPSHIALIDNFLPFEAFTEGFTNSAGVYEPGLNYEFDGLLAAELPFSSSCDAATCFPMTPPEVITGSTAFDRDIGFFEAITGNATNDQGQTFLAVLRLLQGAALGTDQGDLHLQPN